jgi:hypothetical protein
MHSRADGANHSRLTSIIYPNAWTISYNYANGLDDSTRQLTSISDSGTTPESCSYLETSADELFQGSESNAARMIRSLRFWLFRRNSGQVVRCGEGHKIK